MDLSKTFDSVNDDILLVKLEIMGFRGLTLRWLRSFLSGRTSFLGKWGTRNENLC